MESKILVRVGVSRCLCGDAVRYDGRAKPNAVVLEQLAGRVELVAICPEVEAGLAIPRPALQLTGDTLAPRMTGRDDPTLDVTDRMLAFAARVLPEFDTLDGFVFKSRSPSCALQSAPLLINDSIVSNSARGLFAQALCHYYPELPVIEECSLDTAPRIAAFIAAVMHHAKRHSRRQGHSA